MDGIFSTILTGHTDALFVSVARKAARVTQQRGERFVPFHLVEHRAFHLTAHFHQSIVWTHDDDVVVIQSHIASGITVDDVVIDVNRGDDASLTIDLDVAQCTDIVDATSGVKSIECGGERTQRICTWHIHFAHHLHLDATCTAD